MSTFTIEHGDTELDIVDSISDALAAHGLTINDISAEDGDFCEFEIVRIV